MTFQARPREKMRVFKNIFALAFCFVLAAAPAFAAQNPQDVAATETGWIYRWINFAILIGLLVWAFGRKLRPTFRHKQEAIATSITESARAKEEAARQEQEAEARMATLESQIAELWQKARHESAAERERIRGLAQEESRRIAEAAQLEIRAAERAKQNELKTIAARLAIERAEALLRQQMNVRTESALFGEFVAELQGSAL